ncbi:hypothetical protein [Thalassotalea atypica]|uniref:hypothetical protein n=1 Tax=Thalassotalea atypica TaxID=2054316 RepID=UPI0025745D1A|nr:hypothetical protein [Thalassotalea atypica]
MRVLPLILSLLTFTYLASDYFEFADAQAQNSAAQVNVKPYQPKTLAKEPLAAEQSWLAKKLERAEKNAPKKVEKVAATSQQVLALGDQEYILYGIFNDPQKPFILLKGESGNMVRLAKGDKLGQDATLVDLKSNKISFDRNSELIEFKLFERKK